MAIKRVCIFCGSSTSLSRFHSAARSLGRGLANHFTIIYGGGRTGLMGDLADAALEAGGKVIGVIPRALVEKEIAHKSLTELHVVAGMHERKALMLSLADAFVALPGGMGTLEELSEVLSWAKLGIHDKPCVLYNVDGFYDPFLAFLDQSVECNLVSRSELSFLLTARSVRKAVTCLRSFKADGKRPRWISSGNNGR